MPPPRMPVAKALVAMLATATGKPVDYTRIPPGLLNADGTVPANAVYAVVYPIPGGSFSGSASDAHEDADYVFQVSSVAKRGLDAEWLGDRVRGAMLDRLPSGAYRVPLEIPATEDRPAIRVIGRFADSDGGVQPSDGVFTLTERFVVRVTFG